MKKVQHFELSNGEIHSYFNNSEISTIGDKLVNVSGNVIIIDGVGEFPLYDTVSEIVLSRKNNDQVYAFVDDYGVIHTIGKDGQGCTSSDLASMDAIFVDHVDDGFPPYKEVKFTDPRGERPDEYGFVAFNIVKLAEELDNNA